MCRGGREKKPRLLLLLTLGLQGHVGGKLGVGVDGVLGGDEGGSEGVEAILGAGEEEGGELDLGDDFSLTLVDDGQRVNQVVGEHLSDTEASVLLVRGGTEGEGHGGEALVDLGHEGARGLHLEVVGSIGRALEDGGTCLSFTGLSVSGRHDNIDTVDLVGLEGELLGLLISISLVNDNLAAINDETLKLVRQDSLDGGNLEGLGNLGDRGGDLSVGSSNADQAVSNLGSVVSGADNISSAASGGGLGRGSNNDGGGGLRNESVDLDSQVTVSDQSKM